MPLKGGAFASNFP